MPKRLSKRKNIRDMNTLADHIVKQATGEPILKNISAESPKNPAAVTLGSLGGIKSAKARMEIISPERRKEIARKAVEKRCNKQ